MRAIYDAGNDSALRLGSPDNAGLRARILRAGAWTVGQHGIELVARLLSTLIMTRLLFPDAFGQVAAAGSIIAGLALISDFGIKAVILQSPNGDQDCFLRTAWTLQILRGLGLWFILVILCALLNMLSIWNALPAYSVFATPQFSLVTAVMGFSLAVGGLESTAVPLNLRHLRFKPIVFLDLATRSISMPIMIVWAWTAPSVWALVGGILVNSGVRTVFTHVLVPGPSMSLRWNREHIQEIVRFGKWIGISSTGTFISQQSDLLILGFLLPTSALGTYSIAKTLMEAPLSVLDRLNHSLTMSVMSEVSRKDYRKFKDKFYQFRLPFDVLAPLLGGTLVSMGSLIIDTLYDQRYSGAGPVVQILAVALITYPALLFGTALAAAGVPRLAATVSLIQAISLIASMALGYTIAGAFGVIWGIALHKFVPMAVILSLSRQRGWLDIYRELRVLIIFIGGVIMGKCLIMVAAAFGITEITQLVRSVLRR